MYIYTCMIHQTFRINGTKFQKLVRGESISKDTLSNTHWSLQALVLEQSLIHSNDFHKWIHDNGDRRREFCFGAVWMIVKLSQGTWCEARFFSSKMMIGQSVRSFRIRGPTGTILTLKTWIGFGSQDVDLSRFLRLSRDPPMTMSGHHMEPLLLLLQLLRPRFPLRNFPSLMYTCKRCRAIAAEYRFMIIYM